MRKTSLAVFTLVVLAAATPVRGQDVSPPRAVPPSGIDEQGKRAAVPPLDELLRHCTSGSRPTAKCCAPDDRKCEVISKMHGVVDDGVGVRKPSRLREIKILDENGMIKILRW